VCGRTGRPSAGEEPGRCPHSQHPACGARAGLPQLASVFRGAWSGAVALAVTPSDQRDCWNETRRPRPASAPRSAVVGFRFPPEIIAIAVRWYLRYGLSYRDGGRDPRQGRRRVASRQRDERAARRFFERAIGATKSPRLRLSLIGPVCVPDRHGRAALSCMASHRAVRQQPRRGRSRPHGVTAATDARTQAGP
jgi:hypothetical protein